MRKSEMNSLVAGSKIMSVKTGEVFSLVGMDAEQGKYILDNGKTYTASTIKRWYSLVEEEEVEEDNTATKEEDKQEEKQTRKFNGGDKVIHKENPGWGVGTVITIPHGRISSYRVNFDGYEVSVKEENLELAGQEQQDTEEQQDNTANTNTGKTNTGEGTIQQNNLIQSLNSLMDLHNVVMEAKKEYIKVSIPGKRGALCMIRPTRFGTGIHIDFKSKILAKLDENYRGMLIEQYNCSIYDKTRGYYRVFDCSDLEVLRTIILTAKKIA